MDLISVEQSAIANEARLTKEQKLAAIPGYIARLYEGMEDAEDTLDRAKELLQRDL